MPRCTGYRIGDTRKVVIHLDVRCSRPVKPVGRRLILHPRMRRSNVVRHRIEDDLHAARMGRSHESAIVRHRSEVGIDGVHIRCAIAVIRLPGLSRAVVIERRGPKRRDTQLLQVIQMIFDATQIATMVCPPKTSIVRVAKVGKLVIRLVAIREAVRHNQVHHVGVAEPLRLLGHVSPCGERVRHTRTSARICRNDLKLPRRCGPRHKGKKCPMSTGRDRRPGNLSIRVAHGKRSVLQMLAVHQKQRIRDMRKPVRWIDLGDGRPRTLGKTAEHAETLSHKQQNK